MQNVHLHTKAFPYVPLMKASLTNDPQLTLRLKTQNSHVSLMTHTSTQSCQLNSLPTPPQLARTKESSWSRSETSSRNWNKSS